MNTVLVDYECALNTEKKKKHLDKKRPFQKKTSLDIRWYDFELY